MIHGEAVDMKYPNPYTPGAGFMPAYLAGREQMLQDAQKYLEAIEMGYPQQSVVYFGLRGVGKTVLLNAIEEIADNKNILYEHIEIKERKNQKAEPGYFEQQIANICKKFIHAMSIKESAKSLLRRAASVLKGFTVTYNPEEGTISAGIETEDISTYTGTGDLPSDMTDLFVALGKAAKETASTVCFFIDEIQYMKEIEIEALVGAIHRCNQLRLPVMIFGAGLPKILKSMGDAKSYTERLFRFEEVDALDRQAAEYAVTAPAKDWKVTYTEEALEKIIDVTDRYPYFIQAFCSVIWDCCEEKTIDRKAVEEALPVFWENMDKGFFMVRFERCTKREKQFMFAMAKCGELPCTISNVASFMNMNVNKISTFRAQLINKGLIYATGHAEIDFTVPQFDGFLKRINPELEL